MNLRKTILGAAVIFMVMMFPMLLSGCGVVDDVKDVFMPSDSVVTELAEGGHPEYELNTDRLEQQVQYYYDEVSGMQVTKAQYHAYHITDTFKLYGLYFSVACFAIGFLIRRFVKSSANIRKFGLLFELAIPFVYVLLAYGLSYMADRIV